MKTQTEFAYGLAHRLKTADEMRAKHGLTMRPAEDIILIEVQAREVEFVALIDAAREFCAKVERGQARSVRSYAAFKSALQKLNK